MGAKCTETPGVSTSHSQNSREGGGGAVADLTCALCALGRGGGWDPEPGHHRQHTHTWQHTWRWG